MSSDTPTFGPSALATPANALSALRLLGAPVVMAVLLGTGPSWPLVVLWLVLAGTDGADGFVARRQGTTRSGAFLDPLADKALVLGALVALAVRSEVAWVPVAIIALREVAMSGYRSVLGRRGISVPARPLAKLKTVSQDVLVAVGVAPLAGDRAALGVLAWVAVGLTVVSFGQYVWDGAGQPPAGGARRA